MYSDILSTIKTSLDRDILLAEVEILKSALFSPKKGGLEAALKMEIRAATALLIRSQIDKGVSLEVYLRELADAIHKLPEVKLTLSFEPSEAILSVIYNWLITNVAKLVVINVQIDTRVVGGAVISYNGKYYDGSLNKILEATLLANKQRIVEMVTKAS